MATRTITAMFDSQAEAQRAATALESETGIARSAIRVDAGAAATGGQAPAEEKGFLASLRDLFVPDEDRQTYAEGLRRGAAVVSAQVEEADIERAMDVLEQHGAVDLDAREAEWRGAGWSGAGAATVAGTGAAVGAVSDGTRSGVAAMPGSGASSNPPGTMLSRGVDQVAGTNVSGAHPENEGARMARGTGAGAAATEVQATGEERIALVEEQLRVGKREVERGRVRVRSYVVETPVQEQVTLHSETVQVERRAVDRPLTAADDAAFRERTIEATESREEAVVSKEARVREEVVVKKTADERTQTVSDTVRRTEVEVEDGRGAAPGGTVRATETTTKKPANPSRR